jgi:thiol-disulfide isomerase/thioredoxin
MRIVLAHGQTIGQHNMSEAKRRRLRPLRWALEILLVAGVFVAIDAWQTRGMPGDGPAPPFELTSLDGRLVRHDDFRDRTLLVHVWATWCGVCRVEIPALNALYDRLSADEAFVSIVADADDPEAVRRFVAEKGIRYPVLLATDAVLEGYRVKVFPTNYFIGKDGTIRDSSVGMSTRWALGARLGCAAR